MKGIRELEDEYDRASEMGVYVVTERRAVVFDQPTIDFVDTFSTETVEANPEVLERSNSIVATVGDLTDIPGAAHVIPPAELVKAAWEVAPEDIQESAVSTDGTALNDVFLTRPSSLEELAVAVDHVRDNADPPPETRATPSGLAVVGVGLLENLEANLVQLTWLAGRRWCSCSSPSGCGRCVRALLSMVPVLIATGVATILIYLLNIELSPMTAVGGPLVVATCTEFTSLMLLRYIEERRRGLEPREAIDVTAARTGRAFIVSAMTAISGVAVIAFSLDAAAAQLRSLRRPEDRHRPARRPGVPAAVDRLGRQAGMGVEGHARPRGGAVHRRAQQPVRGGRARGRGGLVIGHEDRVRRSQELRTAWSAGAAQAKSRHT